MARLEEFVANLAKKRARRAFGDRAGPALPGARRSRLRRRGYGWLACSSSKGALTTYQARKVLGGATKGFFLGDYRILRSLGEGGMWARSSTTAANQKDGLRVAIKVLPPSKAVDGGQAAPPDSSAREMELLPSVGARHPQPRPDH